MSADSLRFAEPTLASVSDMQPTPEARRHIRYPLRARTEFVWVGRDGVRREARGYSRDISESGAYILAKTSPPVGASIRVVIRFPYLPEPSRSRRIEMNGTVVRVELLLANKSSWGFAVSSTKAFLHETNEPGADSSEN